MTPALSILCAVLAAAVAWQRSSLRAVRDRLRHVESNLESLREGSAKLFSSDAALLAEAHALLHDTAARGKDGRWLPWSERRAAWVKKCEVQG